MDMGDDEPGSGSTDLVRTHGSTTALVLRRGVIDELRELTPSQMLHGMAAMTQSVITRHQEERQKAD
eukprot:1880942-Lingulodinium_polyedra.AAC.1